MTERPSPCAVFARLREATCNSLVELGEGTFVAETTAFDHFAALAAPAGAARIRAVM